VELQSQLSIFAKSLSELEETFNVLFKQALEKDPRHQVENAESVMKSRQQAYNADDSPVKGFYIYLHEMLDNYLGADEPNRVTIRQSLAKHKILVYHLPGYVGKAEKELDKSGDAKWLLRGLGAVSVLDGLEDIRDVYPALNKLYRTAERVGIEPDPYFKQVGAISNPEKTRDYSLPTRQILDEFKPYDDNYSDEQYKESSTRASEDNESEEKSMLMQIIEFVKGWFGSNGV
jgi:hypothetical protein